ncbi:OV-16 antigen-like [Cylas formicarius]|uniref:OV-16 antigen-like n=1 Tax=Cylas formicarius TaxID=197179 RepID=UPI00295898AD|nr:OV-16 antigen-like [Cylas formicarius]
MAISGNILVLLCLTGLTFGVNDVVQKAFRDAEIYPDIISSLPEEFTEADYVSSVVVLGNELSTNESSSEPEVHFPSSDPNSTYTLVLADPDAPSRQSRENAFVRHWLVTNIPGSDFAVANGDVVTPYRGPGLRSAPACTATSSCCTARRRP